MVKVKRPVGGDYEISISVRDVAQVAMTDYCPRCAYISKFMRGKHPYKMPFPGVFSVLDSVSKDVCSDFVQQLGRLPKAYQAGPVKGMLQAFTWSNFGCTYEVEDELGVKHNVRVQGAPDVVVQLAGRRTDHTGKLAQNPLAIYDNKTATLTEGQDAPFGFYTAQIGGYSDIAEKMGLGTVCKRGVVYWQPKAAECEMEAGYDLAEKRGAADASEAIRKNTVNGAIWFDVEMREVTDDFRWQFPKLVQTACEKLFTTFRPERRQLCKNCQDIGLLAHFATTGKELRIQDYI